MGVLKLYPNGSLEYDESEVQTSALGNKARFNMGQISEIEFKKPTFFKNGLIKFKLHHRNDIFCHFTKKRSDEAKKVYDELLQLKNNYQEQNDAKTNEITFNTVDIQQDEENQIEISNNKYCPSCGTKTVPNAKFCMECGLQLDSLIQNDNNIEENAIETPADDELNNLLEREKEHSNKSVNKDYYFSEEAKTKGKQIYNDQKEYLKNHPQDFAMKGAQIHNIIWCMFDTIPKEEQNIVTLTGEGKYYEEMEEYEKAIELYKEADNLTMKVCAKDIQELVDECGPGDYLYTAKIRQRIRVCEKNILKPKILKLESDAKELEKTNPAKAIEIYEHLNELKPGLKKYNKRIAICKNRLE